MYTAENYLWGWVVYSTGAFFLMLGAWLLLRKIPWPSVKHFLLIALFSVLFTPISAYQDDHHLAPAFFVSMYEGLFTQGDTSFQRGLAPILAVFVGLLICYILARSIGYWWGVNKGKQSPKEGEESVEDVY